MIQTQKKVELSCQKILIISKNWNNKIVVSVLLIFYNNREISNNKK